MPPTPLRSDLRAFLADILAELNRRGHAPAEAIEYVLDGRWELMLSVRPLGNGHESPPPDTLPTDNGTTPLESDILEAAAEGPLTARQLAERAGYRLNSHFRTVLARLRRRGLLAHDDRGYRLADRPS